MSIVACSVFWVRTTATPTTTAAMHTSAMSVMTMPLEETSTCLASTLRDRLTVSVFTRTTSSSSSSSSSSGATVVVFLVLGGFTSQTKVSLLQNRSFFKPGQWAFFVHVAPKIFFGWATWHRKTFSPVFLFFLPLHASPESAQQPRPSLWLLPHFGGAL